MGHWTRPPLILAGCMVDVAELFLNLAQRALCKLVSIQFPILGDNKMLNNQFFKN